LQEDALVFGVNSKTDDLPVCLGCSIQLHQRVACPNCKWPMCGRKECMGEGSHHALGECAVLKASHAADDTTSTEEVYISITVLRCLSLRVRDPVKWEKLMNGKVCGFGPRVKLMETTWNRYDVVELVNRWLQKDSVSPELIKKICLTSFFNSYELGSFQKKGKEDMFVSNLHFDYKLFIANFLIHFLTF